MARPQAWRRGSTLDPHEAFIVGMIEEQKDVTLDEMVSRLDAEANVRIGRSALSVWLRRRDRTFEKKTTHALEQERADLLKQRQATTIRRATRFERVSRRRSRNSSRSRAGRPGSMRGSSDAMRLTSSTSTTGRKSRAAS